MRAIRNLMAASLLLVVLALFRLRGLQPGWRQDQPSATTGARAQFRHFGVWSRRNSYAEGGFSLTASGGSAPYIWTWTLPRVHLCVLD